MSSKCNKGNSPGCGKKNQNQQDSCKKPSSGCDKTQNKPSKPKHGGFGSCGSGKCGPNKK